MNKRAMEISINFIIVLILSLAILSGSIVLTKKFFSSAEATRVRLNADTEKELLNLLDDGSPVSLPMKNMAVQAGKLGTTGVGIYNVLGEEKQFKIIVTPKNIGTCNADGDFEPYSIPEQTIGGTGFIKLKNNEKRVVSLVLEPKNDAIKTCKYVFNIEVKYLDGTLKAYDNQVHKLYVTVT